MPWLSNPQRDSLEDIAAAHRALAFAGYPRTQATTEYETYLYRVRAALASPRHTLRAGFLAGAAIAVALMLTAGVLSYLLVVILGSGVPSPGPAGPIVVPGTGDPGTSGRSPLDLVLPAATSIVILAVAGAATALVTRGRWRSAGVLVTFSDVAPRQTYLLQSVAVWVGIGALMVLAVRWRGDEDMVTGAIVMLAFAGIPMLAVFFSAVFPSLYRWLLPRVSPLDAAAYARPIIELEVALQIDSERETHGRGTFHRAFYDRSTWADEVLARLNASRRGRRRR